MEQFLTEWEALGGLLRVVDAAKLTNLRYDEVRFSIGIRKVRINGTTFVSYTDTLAMKEKKEAEAKAPARGMRGRM